VARRLAWFAHSHSASRLLRRRPRHWYSIMLPPHRGQTKLMIEEIILELGSPGSVSTCFMGPSCQLGRGIRLRRGTGWRLSRVYACNHDAKDKT
jgi:hypothetical protein